MSSEPDHKDHPAHIPVEKRLSGDFGSPLEILASQDLTRDHKRSILEVWLRDIEAQPGSPETRELIASVKDALGSLASAPARASD
ncbi:MAG: hypothetical protein JSS20_03275 [Proteobacteria bacterium]|nr:hypothetical protein [Pseudomonadota bacterium]